jgi:hypothetical protein
MVSAEMVEMDTKVAETLRGIERWVVGPQCSAHSTALHPIAGTTPRTYPRWLGT